MILVQECFYKKTQTYRERIEIAETLAEQHLTHDSGQQKRIMYHTNVQGQFENAYVGRFNFFINMYIKERKNQSKNHRITECVGLEGTLKIV